jgi:hypothetical protein
MEQRRGGSFGDLNKEIRGCFSEHPDCGQLWLFPLQVYLISASIPQNFIFFPVILQSRRSFFSKFFFRYIILGFVTGR